MEADRVGCEDCSYRGFLFQDNNGLVIVERCDTCCALKSDDDAGDLARDYVNRLESLQKDKTQVRGGPAPASKVVAEPRVFSTAQDEEGYVDLMRRLVSAAEMGVEVGFCPEDRKHLAFDVGWLASACDSPVHRKGKVYWVSSKGSNIWVASAGADFTAIDISVELFDEKWA